jgi:hypothetical protein
MRTNRIAFVTIIAFAVCAVSWSGAQGAPSPKAPPPGPTAMKGPWTCTTTMANATPMYENDYIDFFGTAGDGGWLHGTARATDGDPAHQPYYDYYLAYTKVQSKWEWIYIQIDPKNGFFVGTSDAGLESLPGSQWKVVYPIAGGSYKFAEDLQHFAIERTELTQVCTRPSQPPTPPPAAFHVSMNCTTTRNEPGSGVSNERLIITPMAKAANWWQGVATDPSGDKTIYEYNIFTFKQQWISIVLNGTTGSFAIAMSKISPNLNDTVWDVVYPTVESGFTFRNVTFDQYKLPSAFTVIFKDGFQRCETSR